MWGVSEDAASISPQQKIQSTAKQKRRAEQTGTKAQGLASIVPNDDPARGLGE
jgi:hypothetical protein